MREEIEIEYAVDSYFEQSIGEGMFLQAASKDPAERNKTDIVKLEDRRGPEIAFMALLQAYYAAIIESLIDAYPDLTFDLYIEPSIEEVWAIPEETKASVFVAVGTETEVFGLGAYSHTATSLAFASEDELQESCALINAELTETLEGLIDEGFIVLDEEPEEIEEQLDDANDSQE